MEFIEKDDGVEKSKKLAKKKKKTNQNVKNNKNIIMKPSELADETKDEPSKNASAKLDEGDDNLRKLIKVKEVELQKSREEFAKTVSINDEEIAKVVAEAEGEEKRAGSKARDINDVRLKIRKLQKLENRWSEDYQEIVENKNKLLLIKDKLAELYEIKKAESKEEIAELEGDVDMLLKMLHKTSAKTKTDHTARHQPILENLPPLTYINQKIKAKELDLECPVCFEVAQTPIFTCEEQHLICSTCWHTVNTTWVYLSLDNDDIYTYGTISDHFKCFIDRPH